MSKDDLKNRTVNFLEDEPKKETKTTKKETKTETKKEGIVLKKIKLDDSNDSKNTKVDSFKTTDKSKSAATNSSIASSSTTKTSNKKITQLPRVIDENAKPIDEKTVDARARKINKQYAVSLKDARLIVTKYWNYVDSFNIASEFGKNIDELVKNYSELGRTAITYIMFETDGYIETAREWVKKLDNLSSEVKIAKKFCFLVCEEVNYDYETAKTRLQITKRLMELGGGSKGYSFASCYGKLKENDWNETVTIDVLLMKEKTKDGLITYIRHQTNNKFTRQECEKALTKAEGRPQEACQILLAKLQPPKPVSTPAPTSTPTSQNYTYQQPQNTQHNNTGYYIPTNNNTGYNNQNYYKTTNNNTGYNNQNYNNPTNYGNNKGKSNTGLFIGCAVVVAIIIIVLLIIFI